MGVIPVMTRYPAKGNIFNSINNGPSDKVMLTTCLDSNVIFDIDILTKFQF